MDVPNPRDPELRSTPMAVAKTITSQAEMTPEYRQTVVQMMESQAYRELAAAVMFGYGLKYVPSLKWLKFMTWHIREEMEHYEAVVRCTRSSRARASSRS